MFLPFQPETPVSGKRGKVIEDKPNKKFKASESGKGSHPTPPGPGRPKSKIAQVYILNTVNTWKKVSGDICVNCSNCSQYSV